MCGIVGFWASAESGNARETLSAMTRKLVHRGPDADGNWSDPEKGLHLSHRRLSILDLSEHGHQPMISRSGRYVLVYNGEVYNLAELRALLAKSGDGLLRGHSDTETMLAAIEAWGLEAALERFIGMFAFALWDREERELILVRDRLGIKPLYYGSSRGTLLFGSELKALAPNSAFDDRIDLQALSLFFRLGFIPGPYSIYQGIKKLPPGCLLRVRSPDSLGPPKPYWQVPPQSPSENSSPPAQLEEELDALLRNAVKIRMAADVPLGSLLSGGVDSSLVTALMQTQSSSPVRTFSIGFDDSRFNEAHDAKEVAARLGTDHTELYVTPSEALSVIPRLSEYYDEPFADSSQIPTFLVSKMAREHVTVALTGDGGDEIWGGYDRYVWGQQVWAGMQVLPKALRSSLARNLARVSPERWDQLLGAGGSLVPRRLRPRLPGDKIHKLAALASCNSPAEFHKAIASLAWKDPLSILQPEIQEPNPWPDPVDDDLVALMMHRDLCVGFPDDMLTKVDRASMAVSLEARVPLADHRLVEFASRVPSQLKIHGREGKVLLRRVLDRYLPRATMERPKMGFAIPLADWLRGPLRSWSEELLSEGRLSEGNLLQPKPIRQAWQEHLSGRRGRHVELWSVLMFQQWRSTMPWSR
jgi:asparagine synthase (glutamine-hydrolysing)